MNRRTRRAILKLAPGIPATIFVACTGGNVQKPEADVYLEGDGKNLAQTLLSKFADLRSLAENPGREMTVAFPTNEGWESIHLSLTEKASNTWKLVREKTGEVATMSTGISGILPAVSLKNMNGQVLEQKTLVPTSQNGMGILGTLAWIVGLVVVGWLGIKVAGFILAALGFLLSTALFVGLIALAATFSLIFVNNFLRAIGGEEGVERFFDRAEDAIREFFDRFQDQPLPTPNLR